MAESVLEMIFRTRKTGSGEKEAQSGLKNLNNAFQDLTGVSLSAAGAFGLAAAGLRKSIAAAQEAESADAQLEAVLKSTKMAAGLTADELDRLSTSLMQQTTFSDEAIKNASSLMLTFTKIGKEVFPDTIKTVLDMSAALGQDLKSSSIQLGKALNDPIKGVSALSEVGVSFTNEQKEMIRVLVETGDSMAAQKVILAELSTEFGGSAAAAADTYAGKLQMLDNNLDNLAASIGEKLIPTLADATSTLNLLLTWQDRVNAAMDEHNKEVTLSSESYDEYVAEMTRAAKAAGFLVREIDGQAVIFERGTSGTIAMSRELQILSAFEWTAAQASAEMARSQQDAAVAAQEVGVAAQGSIEPLSEMEVTMRLAAGAAQAAGQGSRELADAALNLAKAEDQLKVAQEGLASAQQAWREGAGGEIAGMLEATGMKADDLYPALDALDEKFGTNELATKRTKDEMKLLVDEYKRTGDIDAFKQGLKDLEDQFMPLNTQVKEATELIDILQGKVDDLARTYYINLRVNADGLKDLPGWSGGSGGGGEPPVTYTDLGDDGINGGRRAAGGPTYGGRTYLVGEYGPEVLQMPPGRNGYVVPNGQAAASGPLIGQVVINNGMDVEELIYQIQRRTR